MRHRRLISQAAMIGLLIVLPAVAAAHPPRTPFTQPELATVIEALAAQGHPRAYLNKIFSGANLRKLDSVVGFNAMNKESTRDYSGFVKPYALRIARRFTARYRTLLANVERDLGVPKEILVALLQIETQFGKARMRYRVLEVYTTLAVETGPEAVERHYERLRGKYPELERDYLRERLEAKQEFALRELSALVRMGLQLQTKIQKLRGSYAGAFGMPQFLPSSYLRWGTDGNNDNAVGLNNVPDALYSVAAYLRAHGWSEDADEEKQRRAIWEYNHSPEYVEAIFNLARAIPPKRKHSGTAQ